MSKQPPTVLSLWSKHEAQKNKAKQKNSWEMNWCFVVFLTVGVQAFFLVTSREARPRTVDCSLRDANHGQQRPSLLLLTGSSRISKMQVGRSRSPSGHSLCGLCLKLYKGQSQAEWKGESRTASWPEKQSQTKPAKWHMTFMWPHDLPTFPWLTHT